MKASRKIRNAALTLCFVGILVVATGCPMMTPGTCKVVTVIAWDADSTKADVPNDDILNLWVTINKITMVPGDEEDAEEPEDKANSHVVIFDANDSDPPAPITVDLKDLTGVSDLISTAEVPAGSYNQIRLFIEDPVMVLDDGKAEYTNIHLTANSRLFITGGFELPDGETVVQLDFGGVKIVQQGNGDYTWTPQLQATVDVTLVPTTSEGVIAAGSLDTVNDTFVLTLTSGDVTVYYDGAEIYDDTTLVDDGSLAEGQTVRVTGTLVGDELTATNVTIVPVTP